jgi:hypothetical protein
MKKFLLFLIAFAIGGLSIAQPLSGLKSVPGDYASLELAIANLNSQGVGPGGVTFNIAAGHTETLSSPAAGLITATGTFSNPILFQKSGIGVNPLITAGTGTSTTTDGIIKIAGGDYITFNGIDLAENPANATPTTQMEWGYALVKASAVAPFDGCQYVTIKNCVITLNKANTASVGIYAGNHIATSTSSLTITAVTDAMNNCKFYNNTITNAYGGIRLNGYADPAPYTLYDSNNEIGLDGANTITNFGGGNSSSFGIRSIYQKELKVANNNISGGAGTNSTLYGIFISTGTNVDIYSNTITITGGSADNLLYAIRNSSGVPSYTCSIYGNTVTNCTYPTATTGAFYGISNDGTPSILNLYSNSVNNNTLPGTGIFYGIFGGSPANLNMYDNTVYNNSKTGSGTLYCVRAGTSVVSFHDNIIYTNTISTTGTVTAAGIIYGYYNTGPLGLTIYNNQIYDLVVSGTTTSTSSTICGIYTDGDDPYKYLNIIWNLSVTTAGSGTIYGIYTASGGTINIDRNNISNLSACGPSGFVIGIYLPGGTTANITNNMVCDLHKPAANGSILLAGIRIDGGTTVNAYYNTVYLNSTSTGALFGSAALYASTTPAVNLRNNILVNTSTPTGSGITAAYRRSNTTLTSYGSASNNNCFYAGSPSAMNVIFYDGTNSYQTLAEYQALVTPRDNVSVTEMPPFINIASTPFDLHLNTSIPTLLESGGSAIMGFDYDYDNDIRQGSPGYSGGGTAPDIGGDEFEGLKHVCMCPVGNGWKIRLFDTNPSCFWPGQVHIDEGIYSYLDYWCNEDCPQEYELCFISNDQNLVTEWRGWGYDTFDHTYGYEIYDKCGNLQARTEGHSENLIQVVPPNLKLKIDCNCHECAQPLFYTWYRTWISSITFELFNSPISVNIEYGLHGFVPSGLPIIEGDGSINITGLSPSTLYDFYFQNDCDNNGTSIWVGPLTVSTQCISTTLPWSENFDGAAINLPPECSSQENCNSDYDYWGTYPLETAVSSPNVLSINTNTSLAMNDWFYTPGFDLIAGNTYKVEFRYTNDSDLLKEKLEVKWGNEANSEAMMSTIFADTSINYDNVWQYGSGIIVPSISGVYYIGFHGFSSREQSRLFLDDISIDYYTVVIDLTVFLEGPFNGSSMTQGLTDFVPLYQPYNVAPWNYLGTESVMSLPANTIDWVLIELRDAPSAAEATTATRIARQAALLRNDGRVIDLSGNPELNFGPLTITNDFYVVVYHRNHISILSAIGLTQSDGVYTYNFTTGSGQVFGGALAQKELVPGVWGMMGGDGDANGLIDQVDKDPVWEIEAGDQGYLKSDYNLDSQSNNLDKDDIWVPNLGSGSQVP